MMNHLGQPIELAQQNAGWVAIWWHWAGYKIEMGFFPTATVAWDTITDLIQREIAVRALLEVVEEWRENAQVSDREYETSTEALIQSVLV
jgi:hypothetical protein